MKRDYWILGTVEEVEQTLGSSWTPWAKLEGRDDRQIHSPEAVRQTPEGLQVNVGEFVSSKGYINDEWLTPLFIFAKHQCDGCNYPPHMCCLQVSSFRSFDDYDRLGYLEDDALEDAEIMESDSYRDAEDELNAPPPAGTLKEMEV